MYPLIFLILTDISTLISHKARMFVYSNVHLLQTWLALNMVTLLTRNLWKKLRGMSAFTTVIVRISKTKTKRLTVRKKSARNLIYLVSSEIFFESKTDVSFLLDVRHFVCFDFPVSTTRVYI